MTRYMLFTLFILLNACETPFDPKIEENSEIVVNSFFRPGHPFQVNLTKSNFILDPEQAVPVPQAVVTISNTEGLIETLTGDGEGNFNGSFYPELGNEYFLGVEAAGFPVVNAADKIPEAVAVQFFSLQTTLSSVNLDESGYKASLTFKDPPETQNYYGIEVIINRTGTTDPLSGDIGFIFTEDPDVNTTGNNDINVGNPALTDVFPILFFDDIKFDGESHQLDFFLAPVGLDFSGNVNYEIHVVLKSISRSYYNYLLTSFFQKEIEDEESHAEPVQVANNIQNGLGIFAGYNFDIMKAELVE